MPFAHNTKGAAEGISALSDCSASRNAWAGMTAKTQSASLSALPASVVARIPRAEPRRADISGSRRD
jgi:hypothetical protein